MDIRQDDNLPEDYIVMYAPGSVEVEEIEWFQEGNVAGYRIKSRVQKDKRVIIDLQK